MLNEDVAHIPKDEWHRPSGLCVPLFCIIPLYMVQQHT